MRTGPRAARAALSTACVLGAILALAGLALALESPFRQSRLPLEDDEELSLFPRSAWVRPLTFGRARLAADFAWLEAIQYYGRHRMSDRRYPYAETLIGTITGLDPQFEAAYIFGALVVLEETGRTEKARELLAAGMAYNPESWRLCFEYGFFDFLERRDSAEAAVYLARASRMKGAPPSVGRLAAYAAGRAGETELAIELWREMSRSAENEEVRRIAQRYLQSLGAPEEDAAGRSEGVTS